MGEMNGCETEQGRWPMRLAQYQVWVGREDGKAEPGWDGRTVMNQFIKNKTKKIILIHL